MPHKPNKESGCWGSLVKWCGWTGDKGHRTGDCEKKPREGKLTCWWHRWQEIDAKHLKKRLDTYPICSDPSTIAQQ